MEESLHTDFTEFCQLFKQHGVEFRFYYERPDSLRIRSELSIPMISRSKLLTNKLASARPKDFADLAHALPTITP
jgi:hypothetical protein